MNIRSAVSGYFVYTAAAKAPMGTKHLITPSNLTADLATLRGVLRVPRMHITPSDSALHNSLYIILVTIRRSSLTEKTIHNQVPLASFQDRQWDFLANSRAEY